MNNLPFISDEDWDLLVEYLHGYGFSTWDLSNQRIGRAYRAMKKELEEGTFVPAWHEERGVKSDEGDE